MSDNNREIELKFLLDAPAERQLRTHPLLATSGDHGVKRLVSIYFDTADGRLRRRRCSLRIRQNGMDAVQTFKGPGRSIADRDEWEHGDAGSFPKVKWLRATPLWSKLGGDKLSGALEAQFTVEVSRTTIPMVHRDAQIEVAIDSGTVHARGRTETIHECEFELKSGSDEQLWDFARQIVGDVPLRLSTVTKAERGFDLLDGSSPGLRKTIAVDLQDVDTVGAAFASIVQVCLATICRNALFIGAGRPEGNGVHETRIAVRHLRAALDLFAPVLRRKQLRSIVAEVKWISDKLGAARDADVFEMTRPQIVPKPDNVEAASATGIAAGQFEAFVCEEDRAAVDTHLDDLRLAAHRDLLGAIGQKRWRFLLIDLLRFSAEGVRRSMRDEDAVPFVSQQLTRRRTELADLSRRWSKRSSEELHDIRKRAKMLRYALDLVVTLPGLDGHKRRVKNLSGALQTLQQALGDVHDADALRDHLSEVFLRRAAPSPVDPQRWAGMQQTAMQIAGAVPQHNQSLDKAHQAARRVKRSKAF